MFEFFLHYRWFNLGFLIHCVSVCKKIALSEVWIKVKDYEKYYLMCMFWVPESDMVLSCLYYLSSSLPNMLIQTDCSLLFFMFQEGNEFQNAVFNETINVVEPDEGLDGETFFLYVFLIAIVVLLLVGAQQLLTTFGVSLAFYIYVIDYNCAFNTTCKTSHLELRSLICAINCMSIWRVLSDVTARLFHIVFQFSFNLWIKQTSSVVLASSIAQHYKLKWNSSYNVYNSISSEKAFGKGKVGPKGRDGDEEYRCGLQLAPTGNSPGNEYVMGYTVNVFVV